MSVLYNHTQRGTAILTALALAAPIAALTFVLDLSQGSTAVAWPVVFVLAPVLAILAGAAWYFYSMTVEVTDTELRWHFGPRHYYRIARAEIEGVSIVRHPWWAGYGIRWFAPKRWAYIVSGRDAVEVRLKNGGWSRIGTDDPLGLSAALKLEPK
jgi:hypothetical protein